MKNNIRTTFCVLLTTLLAFGLPGIAAAISPNKHFALSVAVGAADNTQQDTTLTALVINDNPSGSSAQFGSFTISVANVSGIIITSAQPDLTYGQGQTVSVSADGLSVSVSGLKPNVLATQSYQLTLHVKGCGDGNTWSAIVYTGTNLTGATYVDDGAGNETTNISCGALACNGTRSLGVTGSVLSGLLGDFTQDGQTTCSTNYYVTNLTANSALATQQCGVSSCFHLRWAPTTPLLAFYYVANFQPKVTTKFAWIADKNGTPIFDDALTAANLQCELNPNITTPGDQLPEPIGTVLADNGGKIIKVDTSQFSGYPLQAPPFHITIGPAGSEEYLLVTKINQQSWTVTRGKPAYMHPVGTLVMTTVQPPIPNTVTHVVYKAGGPAQMCFAGSFTDSTTAIYDFDPLGNGWGNP